MYMKFSALKDGLIYSHSISMRNAKPSNRQRVLNTMETVPTLTAVFLTAHYLGWTSDHWRKRGLHQAERVAAAVTRLCKLPWILSPRPLVTFLDTLFRVHWKLQRSCSNKWLWQIVDMEILRPGSIPGNHLIFQSLLPEQVTKAAQDY